MHTKTANIIGWVLAVIAAIPIIALLVHGWFGVFGQGEQLVDFAIRLLNIELDTLNHYIPIAVFISWICICLVLIIAIIDQQIAMAKNTDTLAQAP